MRSVAGFMPDDSTTRPDRGTANHRVDVVCDAHWCILPPKACRTPPVRGEDRVHLTNKTELGSTRTSLPYAADTGITRRRLVVPDRHVPVRPDLSQLKRQAKELLRAIVRGDAKAVEEFVRNHPRPPDAQ